MSEDYDYLTGISSDDKKVLKNLSAMGEQLKQLRLEAIKAEAAFDTAKKAYEHYANVVIPAEMFAAGIDSLSLATGGTLRVKRNFYCQPNKNDTDRKTMIQWLKENGGEHLIKHDAKVSSDDISALEAQNIPFIDETSVNTNSLKSFLKDKVGATSGIQQIKIEDIPACIHFQEVTTVDLEMPEVK